MRRPARSAVRRHTAGLCTRSLHGPDRQLRLGGSPVVSIVPLASAETGNMRLSFGCSPTPARTITVVADPDTVPDLSDLGGALRAGLATLGRTVEAVS